MHLGAPDSATAASFDVTEVVQAKIRTHFSVKPQCRVDWSRVLKECTDVAANQEAVFALLVAPSLTLKRASRGEDGVVAWHRTKTLLSHLLNRNFTALAQCFKAALLKNHPSLPSWL